MWFLPLEIGEVMQLQRKDQQHLLVHVLVLKKCRIWMFHIDVMLDMLVSITLIESHVFIFDFIFFYQYLLVFIS